VSTDVREHGHTRYSHVCWASSIVFHGIVVSAALALVSELTLPPSKEMFTWEVAVVETPAPPEPAAPPPPPVAPTLPEPQPVKTPAPVKPRPMRQQPVVQAMEPQQEKQPVEQAQPVQEVQPVQELQSVKEAQPLREARLEQALQPVQQAPHEQVTPMSRPVQEESRPSREVTQSVSRSDAPVEAAESIEKPAATVQSVGHTEATVQDHVVASAPVPSERGLIEESHAPIETAQKVEQPITARTTPTVQQRSLQHMPVKARPTARPDYGWLAQALWANVDQRKRYPLEAKLNRWEGKVILRLTIEQRGTSVYLIDLALEESSGHAILDRHTQDIVRKAFPIEVKHALSQPRVQLHLPFSYSME
jgi:protein TonB